MALKLIGIILVSIFCTPVQAIDSDKQKHLVGSAVISTITYSVARAEGLSKHKAIGTALSVTIALGLIKELTDDKFDKDDLKYDIGGAVLPLVIFSF